MSALILKLLKSQSESAYETRSSELVPFAARLCGRLAEYVSEVKSLFSESSPSDGTVSALSATPPSESPFLNGSTVLEILCEGFTLLDSLLLSKDDSFDRILIDCDFVPLLKSTIIACLDLLEQPKSESNCPPAGQTDMVSRVLYSSWDCAASSLCDEHKSLHPIVEFAFSDVPQLCSLLLRTFCHLSPKQTSHLRMIVNVSASLPHLIRRMLEENLVQRVIDTSRPMTVPTTHVKFHLYLVWAISSLIWNPTYITKDKEERKRIRHLQFECALKLTKPYLQFILQREEFITNAGSDDQTLPTVITMSIEQILLLERDLFEYGEIVETGREVWEVGWLMEKMKERELGERLKKIRKDDVRMKKDEKSKWKKRVERRREAGHEDAMEGMLTNSWFRFSTVVGSLIRTCAELVLVIDVSVFRNGPMFPHNNKRKNMFDTNAVRAFGVCTSSA
ncbi:hypothetical protein BLNAU_10936 [Blattamonas nauphoetae]|uniref:Uncharacterized protein n=1 Tax=Blattamonas nauphoetae TaxID=2049346 RepID=A0ABQ9XR59_9EUKA|nr:hypothetical protein BLNAU_10936 [Blattamonas nauphoetae]